MVVPYGRARPAAPAPAVPEQPPAVVEQPPPPEEPKVVESGYRS
ncbi:unnamed protein product [Strongylus vulgaris]|uniref:Uncharacterized protein n=1 Tax=Strongylus vulgaris TaxID=40348 RepID=A0A3P7LVX6_STRVU|nr:unnamed protein product [Strongylus vulgaris]